MYDIEMQEATPDFAKMWQAAGLHLDKQVQGGMQSWLRADLNPPFLEHLSFRLGNQLFFVRVVDVDGKVEGPAGIRGLMTIADRCKGHACLMPMKKKLLGGWTPDAPGWGLTDARSNRPVDPVSLVTDELIEMTDWELQDFGVQVVRGYLENQGHQLMSWQGNPEVDPSIWFVGESGGPEWVVVRTVRYPDSQATRPGNWDAIADGCAKQSRIGHFATVALASMDDPFDPDAKSNGNHIPLYRGHGMHVRFTGLE